MLNIESFVVSPFSQNSRILYDNQEKKAVVIDPGADIPRLTSFLVEKELKVQKIFLTHSHIDHVAGLKEFLTSIKNDSLADDLKTFGSLIEKEMRSRIELQAEMFGLNPTEYQNAPEPDIYLEGGEEVSFLNYKFKVLHTPGHSPGHLVFFLKEGTTWIRSGDLGNDKETSSAPVLIAGDTVFKNSVGRVDLPGSKPDDLIKSIKEKITTLPDNTVILSGHMEDTILLSEKNSNPFFKEFSII